MALSRARDRLVGALASRPLVASAGLLVGLGTLRTAEVLVLRLHADPGTLGLSAVAMLAVGLLVVSADRDRSVVLPSKSRRRRALLVGGLAVALVQVAARGLELATLALTAGDPVLVVRPENPATKSTAGGQVLAYVVFGVLVTAVGEELFFRRAVLDAVATARGFWRANAAQALLFGAWHFAWPLVLAVSAVEPYPPLWVYAGGLFVVTTTTGLLYGWLVHATGTVWTAVLAHLLHNTAAVVLHVRTTAGGVRGSSVAAGVLVGYLAVALWAHRRYG